MHSMLVPDWYSAAHQKHLSPEKLRKLIFDHSVAAMERAAKRQGQAVAGLVDPNVVEITFEMYEAALQASGK